MLLNNGEVWEPIQSDIIKWNDLYPAVNIKQELRKMEGWLDANPRRRKTKMGIKRFVNAWLSKAQDQGGSPDLKSEVSCITRTRDMTSLDNLSDNFIGCPEIRKSFIAKYGQSYENGRRYTCE